MIGNIVLAVIVGAGLSLFIYDLLAPLVSSLLALHCQRDDVARRLRDEQEARAALYPEKRR